MGLRFRKSVTLCKGVKLNFGKTGASVSLGTKGFHKTFHTSGRVTTSVGIPGTGIYWTESTNSRSGRNRNVSSSTRQNIFSWNQQVIDYEDYDELVSNNNYLEQQYNQQVGVSGDIESTSNSQAGSNAEIHMEDFWEEGTFSWNQTSVPREEEIETRHRNSYEETCDKAEEASDTVEALNLTESDIKAIYSRCDDAIDWSEVQAGTSAEDLYMNATTWRYCRSIATRILKGDIDAYLEAIEELRPVDDLLLYGGEFEFGTDHPSYIEIEFRMLPDGLLTGGMTSDLFEMLMKATTIRVARDLMALLPVKTVLIHVVVDDRTVFSIKFSSNEFARINFRQETSINICNRFEHNEALDGAAVTRIDL